MSLTWVGDVEDLGGLGVEHGLGRFSLATSIPSVCAAGT